jgi:HEAT repeat protein
MIRSYPTGRWEDERRAAVARAVELGLWPGPAGAQIAVSSGLARSRKELAILLQRHFAATVAQPLHGLDDAAVRENWKALKAESRALGLPVREWALPRSQPIMSESVPVASGTIGDSNLSSSSDLLPALARSPVIVPLATGDAPGAPPADGLPVLGLAGWAGQSGHAPGGELAEVDSAELATRLADRGRRQAAAVELCRRAESPALQQVFDALEDMTRAEASGVFAAAVHFGRAAEPRLLAALQSRKVYLRHGAALALAVIRSEAGVEAICDLVLEEPTAMWREVARGLGEAGPAAVMPLAAGLAARPEAARKRAAWALAHVAARGARRPIQTLAAGRDPVAAAVARSALGLVQRAIGDDLKVRGLRGPRDQTLNRAFSRRFFAALRAERRAAAEAAARAAGDTASRALLSMQVDLPRLEDDDPASEAAALPSAGSRAEDDAPPAGELRAALAADADPDSESDDDGDMGIDATADAGADGSGRFPG